MNRVITKFDALKRVSKNGANFWLARDLQQLLGYSKWSNFQNAIKRAQDSCDRGGTYARNHFAEVGKQASMRSESERPVKDFALSRFACYLIAMNGDPSKPEIAAAQEYFATETRKSELVLQMQQAKARIEERGFVTLNNKKLHNAAQTAGVRNFARFNNAGYQAMYGGLNSSEIKKYKGISEKEGLLDRIGRAELAANNFRITQAETKLQVENTEGEDEAVRVHAETGMIVRETMGKAGKILPEDLPAEPHIKEVKKLVKKYDNHIRVNSGHAVSSSALERLS